MVTTYDAMNITTKPHTEFQVYKRNFFLN